MDNNKQLLSQDGDVLIPEKADDVGLNFTVARELADQGYRAFINGNRSKGLNLALAAIQNSIEIYRKLNERK